MARRCLVQDELNKTSECRRQIDDQLDEVRGVFTDKQKLLTCERKRSDDLRAELENISLRLFYLDNAKNDVRSACAAFTHTHPLNGRLSGTTQVSRYQKGKTSLDFTEARDSEWQWYQLGHMQVCTSLQTDNHTSTPPLSCHPAAQPTASKH